MTERRQLSVQQIRIGIIGTQTIVDKIMKIIETFPSFDPVPLVFRMMAKRRHWLSGSEARLRCCSSRIR